MRAAFAKGLSWIKIYRMGVGLEFTAMTPASQNHDSGDPRRYLFHIIEFVADANAFGACR